MWKLKKKFKIQNIYLEITNIEIGISEENNIDEENKFENLI